MYHGQLTQQSADLLVALLTGSPDIVIVIDADGVIGFANEAARRTLGHAPDEWLGRSAFELIHPDDRQRVSVGLATHIADPAAGFEPVALRIADLAGHWVPVEAHGIRPMHDARVSGMAVVLREITARVATEDCLSSARQEPADLGARGPLTMLPDRDHVERQIDRLANSRPDSMVGLDVLAELFMVKVVDVDRVRIRYGEAETDAIIRSLAERVCREVGADHVVGTTGDGELVVLVEWMPRGLSELADRLLALADSALSSRQGRVDIDLAVGVVPLPSGMSGDEALDRVTQAAGWGARASSHRRHDSAALGANVIQMPLRPRQPGVPEEASGARRNLASPRDLDRSRGLLG